MTSSPPSPAAPAIGASERYGRWILVALWCSLVLSAGPALADALDPRERAVQIVASVGLWLAWAAGLGALLVPRTVTLTAVRIVVPAAVPVAAWAALAAAPGTGNPTFAGILAVGTTLAATVVVSSAPVGDGFVNGSSYGDERRMPLRPPGHLLAGPIPLAWLACVAGAVTGPLLLANGSWIAGALATVVGWAAAYVAARALHNLARRWVVFVPAGFVLHDPMALAEPLLMTRRELQRVGPALADTRATDFTVGALGLALQADLNEPTTVTPLTRGVRPTKRAQVQAVEVTSLLFSPSRPGAVLREAGRRRVPVG